MTPTEMHGMVLSAQEGNYTDLTKYGTVTIKRRKDGEVVIYVSGFNFAGAGSCRQTVLKAVAWARDVLGTAANATSLVPGGKITVVAD